MKRNLWQSLQEVHPPRGSVALSWLGGAGFALKSPGDVILLVDPYLSDCVERLAGFKRIMPSPLEAADVSGGLIVSTHAHPDHLDVDAIPLIAQWPPTRFAGPPSCVQYYDEIGIPPDRYWALQPGGGFRYGDVRLTAVFADHGTLAPDSVGVIMELDGTRIYHTGDTAFVPERMGDIAAQRPAIILPCINGAFGNMGPEDAARLVAFSGARLAIPAHYWMFAEHNGDPAKFLEACGRLAPAASTRLLTQGELVMVGDG